jgi:peptidyl-prolyl cis-trans isomerase SurA
MKRIFAICLAAAGLSAAGSAVSQTGQVAPPASSAPAPRGQIVDAVAATVNDAVITQSDVRNRMRLILLSFGGQPTEEILQEAKRRAIDMLIDEKVQLQEFEKLVKEQKIDDAEIDEEIENLDRQNKMTTEQFLDGLRQAGVSIQSLREKTKAEIAWTALIRGRYARTVRVSDLRVDETMERLQDSLNEPKYSLAEIFLYAPDQGSRANAKTTAERLIGEINRGADFRAVAQQFSAAPSASQGGDVGWMSLGDMRPEVARAVGEAPAPPTILPPIESDGGIYVIAVLGKQDPTAATAAVVNLRQVVARGDDAAAKLAQVKAKASVCADVPAAIEGMEGVTSPDVMNGVSLTQIAPAYRPALENVQAGGSTDALDLPNNAGKMVFYVCDRETASVLPTREQIRSQLFSAELGMIEERYLRDLKRKASIQER